MSDLSVSDIKPWTTASRLGRRDRGDLEPAQFSRRTMVKGMLAAAGLAASGVSFAFATAKKAGATQGYEIMGVDTTSFDAPCNSTRPGYAIDHNCSPGCGPSTVYSDACNPYGYHLGGINSWYTDANGVQWMLRPDECAPAAFLTFDGWKWAAGSGCSGCDGLYWRCHDGWVHTIFGTYKSVCRACTSSTAQE